MMRQTPHSTLFPTRRSSDLQDYGIAQRIEHFIDGFTDEWSRVVNDFVVESIGKTCFQLAHLGDRKSTRLNSSHVSISYAVFCLKKKNNLIVLFRWHSLPGAC